MKFVFVCCAFCWGRMCPSLTTDIAATSDVSVVEGVSGSSATPSCMSMSGAITLHTASNLFVESPSRER